MQADFSAFVFMDRGEIVIYQTADGETRLDVRMESDSVWLTQGQIAQLFGVDRTVIVRHVNNIYKSSELERQATCAKIAQVQHEGLRLVRRMIPYYNLDMILSVGYRVNSKNATQFRIWANKVLKEYLIHLSHVRRSPTGIFQPGGFSKQDLQTSGLKKSDRIFRSPVQGKCG